MTETTNRQWALASRPVGYPKEADFKLVESPIPEPRHGEVLVQTLWLSLDPYVRGRMNAARSYAAPVGIGSVMQASWSNGSEIRAERGRIGCVKRLRAEVKDGRLVLNEPARLPEGTILELAIAADEDELNAKERAALDEALSKSRENARAGHPRPVEDALEDLRLD